MTNEVTEKKISFQQFMTAEIVQKKVMQMVGSKDGQKFITSILSAVMVNPALSECDHNTILSAAMLGEGLKLSPSPQLGHYYMVPFEDKKNNRKVATFILGYKGYIQLAIRSGYYKKINVLAIKEGELIKYDPLEEELTVNLIQDDYKRESAKTIGYYAMFEYHSGFKKTLYWSKEKMEKHADTYAPAFHLKDYMLLQEGKISEKDMWKYSSFWYKDFDGMAFKTMLRQLISKWGIMSIELQSAYESDGAEIDNDGSPRYIEPETAPVPATVDVQLPGTTEQSEDPKVNKKASKTKEEKEPTVNEETGEVIEPEQSTLPMFE
jgi:recombination protein RecT